MFRKDGAVSKFATPVCGFMSIVNFVDQGQFFELGDTGCSFLYSVVLFTAMIGMVLGICRLSCE